MVKYCVDDEIWEWLEYMLHRVEIAGGHKLGINRGGRVICHVMENLVAGTSCN